MEYVISASKRDSYTSMKSKTNEDKHIGDYHRGGAKLQPPQVQVWRGMEQAPRERVHVTGPRQGDLKVEPCGGCWDELQSDDEARCTGGQLGRLDPGVGRTSETRWRSLRDRTRSRHTRRCRGCWGATSSARARRSGRRGGRARTASCGSCRSCCALSWGVRGGERRWRGVVGQWLALCCRPTARAARVLRSRGCASTVDEGK